VQQRYWTSLRGSRGRCAIIYAERQRTLCSGQSDFLEAEVKYLCEGGSGSGEEPAVSGRVQTEISRPVLRTASLGSRPQAQSESQRAAVFLGAIPSNVCGLS